MFVFNEPKAAIADAMESGVLDTGAQTSYSVLFMPALALNLIILALYPLITKMAILWTAGDTRRYKSLLIRIILSLLIISVVILGIAFLIGIEVLELVFGIKLDGQRPLFMLLLAGGCCNAIMNVFANAITVIRKQYALLFGSASVAFAVLFCSRRLVNGQGLLGAGKVFLSSQMALMIIEAVVCFVLTMKQMKEQKQSMTEPHE